MPLRRLLLLLIGLAAMAARVLPVIVWLLAPARMSGLTPVAA